MTARPRITHAQRRARLVARHHLGRTASDVMDAVEGVVALHSSDPVTPHLGAWARVPGYTTPDLERALCEARTLWRLHAMRRTLFVVPVAEAPVFGGAVCRDIARKERQRIETWLSAEMDADRVSAWLADLEARTLDALAARAEWRTQDLVPVVAGLDTAVTLGSGKWTTRSPLSSRLLFLLAMEGRVVRTRPAGTWRSSQYHWAAASTWFAQPCPTIEETAARAALAGRYLAAHGPATLRDLRWWTGWTARQASAALRALDAVSVDLDDGDTGLVLPGDLDHAAPDPVHVSLLPGLDSTPMGWKDRDWYLGTHAERLFDRNGNVGPTVWADGRVIGGWAQRPDGEVVVGLLEDVGRETAQRVDEEAAALTRWMGGVAVTPRFRTPLERELAAG